ncbi:MAG: FixH family protein [Pseudomonadota bacterium]
MSKPLTGRKVLAIAIGCFGLVVAANLTMLFSATGTFPGLVVKNSYVASQHFNAEAEAQQALGWKGSIVHDGEWLEIRLTDRDGLTVAPPSLTVVVGRPTTDAQDRTLELMAVDGVYRAAVALAPGRWRVEARATGATAFKLQTTLHTKGT